MNNIETGMGHHLQLNLEKGGTSYYAAGQCLVIHLQ